MGATRALSWWGVLGYATASAVPALILCGLGPLVRARVGADAGFSATDFALARYGRLMHLHVCCISCFYMYIYMVAELTTLGNVYATLVGKSVAGDDSEAYTTRVAVVGVVFTWASRGGVATRRGAAVPIEPQCQVHGARGPARVDPHRQVPGRRHHGRRRAAPRRDDDARVERGLAARVRRGDGLV